MPFNFGEPSRLLGLSRSTGDWTLVQRDKFFLPAPSLFPSKCCLAPFLGEIEPPWGLARLEFLTTRTCPLYLGGISPAVAVDRRSVPFSTILTIIDADTEPNHWLLSKSQVRRIKQFLFKVSDTVFQLPCTDGLARHTDPKNTDFAIQRSQIALLSARWSSLRYGETDYPTNQLFHWCLWKFSVQFNKQKMATAPHSLKKVRGVRSTESLQIMADFTKFQLQQAQHCVPNRNLVYKHRSYQYLQRLHSSRHSRLPKQSLAPSPSLHHWANDATDDVKEGT